MSIPCHLCANKCFRIKVNILGTVLLILQLSLNMKTLFIIWVCIFASCDTMASDIELGKVKWLRDLKEAQISSKNLSKPILILFQEVPGCSTCKNYGSQVLSHPLIVEAIETYFVPLCIHNNKKGKDSEALQFFSEPSWNNPVVRIVDSNLNGIVDRINGNYSEFGLITKINTTLLKLGIKIPEYLNILEEEFKAKQTGLEHATISMYCFWTGEKTYGKVKGVVATNAGFMNGSEVVDILYNPNETNLNELINIGKKNNSADKLYSNNISIHKVTIPVQKQGTFRIDAETKYYLYQSDYKFVPMTALQATRANSMLAEGKSCEFILSPGQINLFKKNKSIKNSKLKNQIGRDIILAWYEG